MTNINHNPQNLNPHPNSPLSPTSPLPGQPGHIEDVSRRTVIALLVLVAVVSLLGTWVVQSEINAITNVQPPPPPPKPVTAEISFEIIDPNAQEEPIEQATGYVTFEILE